MMPWCLGYFLVSWASFSHASEVGVSISEPLNKNTTKPTIFSPTWEYEYFSGEQGCTFARGYYAWRPAGFGSNINNLLYSWVYSLMISESQDLAIIIPNNSLGSITCGSQSGVEGLEGWDCIFAPMPHLCIFRSYEEWDIHLQAAGLSSYEREVEKNKTRHEIRVSTTAVEKALIHHGTDHLRALGILQRNLWHHLAPWVKRGTQHMMELNGVLSNINSPFLAIHIRRGDKIIVEKAKAIPVEDFLSNARNFLRRDGATVRPSLIKGIWVASDDKRVIATVRHFAPKYFPKIQTKSVVWISGEATGKVVKTHTIDQGFADFIPLLVDLHHLAQGEVFVGTFSSNWGRLVHIMREGLNKPRNGTISLDIEDWRPVRRQLDANLW